VIETIFWATRSDSVWALVATQEAPSINFTRSLVPLLKMFYTAARRYLSVPFSSMRSLRWRSTSLSAKLVAGSLPRAVLNAVWLSRVLRLLPPWRLSEMVFFNRMISTEFSLRILAISLKCESFMIACASPKKSSISRAS